MKKLSDYIVNTTGGEIYKLLFMKEVRIRNTRETRMEYVTKINDQIVSESQDFIEENKTKVTMIKLSENAVSDVQEQLLIKHINNVRNTLEKYGEGLYIDNKSLHYNGRPFIQYGGVWIKDVDKLNGVLKKLRDITYGFDKSIYRYLDSERYQTYKQAGSVRGMFTHGLMEKVFGGKWLRKDGEDYKYVGHKKMRHTLYKLFEGSFICYGEHKIHDRWGHIEEVVSCRKAISKPLTTVPIKDFIKEHKLNNDEIEELLSNTRCNKVMDNSCDIDSLEKVYIRREDNVFELVPYFELGSEEILIKINELTKNKNGKNYIIAKKIINLNDKHEKMIEDTICNAYTLWY